MGKQAHDEHQLAAWFDEKQQKIEASYLESDNPYQQSGWGSKLKRWRLGRELILNAVSHNGTFLDIGCAKSPLLQVAIVL